MNRSTIDLWVGIFFALGISAITFLSLRASNLITQSATQTYTLYADFENVGGLKVQAPVKEAGVLIGRVSNIRLNPTTYHANVTMNIENTYQISDDACASILTSGLLGEQYIGITQGSSETNLTQGGTIKISSSALVLEQLIGKLLTTFTENNKTVCK